MSNSPTDTVVDCQLRASQISMTWRSMAKGTRQLLPPSQSTEAVRWLMRAMVPTWGCRYLSVNETLSPPTLWPLDPFTQERLARMEPSDFIASK